MLSDLYYETKLEAIKVLSWSRFGPRATSGNKYFKKKDDGIFIISFISPY